jgi:hypothetical protein
MTKLEADKKCILLFGMNSEDYARKVLRMWEEDNKEKEPKKPA